MKTLAAILVEPGKPLVLDEIEIPKLQPGQVLVAVKLSGVCGTQVLECNGHRGVDPYLPHCLGHEGSGIVQDVATGVSKVKPGDRVILSWIKGSGANVLGTVYDWNGKKVNAGAITTFSRHAVISENRVTPAPFDLSLRDAALMGCAVATGFGSVFNTAQAKPGDSVAVFGVGGIGLCAIAAAVMAGCTPIVAVDVVRSRLETALKMGADKDVNATAVDPIDEVMKYCGGPVDVALECSGRPEVMAQALRAVRSQGGIAVVVGNARQGERVSFDPKELNQGKQFRGTWGGDNEPDRDFPRYAKLIASRKVDLAPLVSTTYPLQRVNEALKDLETGETTRPLLDMCLEAS